MQKSASNMRRYSGAVAAYLLAAMASLTCATTSAAPDAAAVPRPLVPGNVIGGPNGMRFGPDGALYVGSVLSETIFRVDSRSGDAEPFLSGPDAGADDMVFLPDGTLVWTAFFTGKVMARDPNGTVRAIASDLPGVDGIGYDVRDKRLFVSQCFAGDALWEIDPAGAKPPHKLLDDLGCLNGFDFGPHGRIYGPSWFHGTILRIDPDSGETKTIVSGLKTPAAAKFGRGGALFVANAGDGRVLRIDVSTGKIAEVAQLGSDLDNLLPVSRDRLLVSSLGDTSIVSIDLGSHAVSTLVQGQFSAPAGLAICKVDGHDRLYVADITTLNTVDPANGSVTEIGRDHPSKGTQIISAAMVSTGRSIIILSGFSGQVQWLDQRTDAVLGSVSGLASPYGTTELPDGTIAVAEFGAGRIGRIDPRTSKLLAPIATGLDGPAGLALGPDGTLLVSEASAGRIARVNIATGAIRRIAKGLKSPEGLALTPDGTLIIAEAGASRLLTLDPKQAGTPHVLAADLPIGLPPGDNQLFPFLPTGVAVSDKFIIYFSSDMDHGIYRLPMTARAEAKKTSASFHCGEANPASAPHP